MRALPTETESGIVDYLAPLAKLSRDERAAGAILTSDEARYLVDYYYITQKDRIRASNQKRALDEAAEPNEAIQWLAEQSAYLEAAVKSLLDRYSANHPIGVWARAQKGVGPVIAAGLLAHIDIHKAPTMGHIWRFAGLDPTVIWGKGEKRPWNAALKTLCWKLGESFTKVSGSEDAFYGRCYVERKAQEWHKNAAGEFSDQARKSLEVKRFGQTTDAYKWYNGTYSGVRFVDGKPIPVSGDEGEGIRMLPPARIHLRAQRWAVKLFLGHLHEVWHRVEFGTEPPAPYPIAILKHAHLIKPPPPVIW